jgi:hypothetical protein
MMTKPTTPKTLTSNERTDTETEMRVLAMVARGDTYSAIRAQLQEDGITMSPATITAIKKRNPKALAKMESMLADHATSSAQKILKKAHKLIDKRLEQADNSEKDAEELHKKYEAGEITFKEYLDATARLFKISVSELTSLSKEMFHQSQVEQGKPTSITESAMDAKQEVVDIAKALENVDEVELQRIIFRPNA